MEIARRQDHGQSTRPPFSPRIPLVVAAAFFMEMLDGTIIATALPSMAQDLHVRVGGTSLDLLSRIKKCSPNSVRVAPNLARYALDARFLQTYGQFT
jgi:hypothetical protein